MRNNPILYEQMKVRGEDNYAHKLTWHKTKITNLKTIHIMFTFDIKAIRNEYKNLSLLVEKENNTASEKNLTAMARTISDEDIQQIFSEQHGGIVDAISKTTDNAVFTIILDNIKGKLELSQFVGIKDTNGVIVIMWNIEDETMTLLPLLK